MKGKLWLILALTAALGLALGGAAMAKTIKIGMVDCYSGPPSTYTNDVRDAFKLYIKKVNAKGGVWGNKFEVLTRDSKFKVDLGLAAAKELIMREGVSALVGTINSGLALAISDLAQRENIPFFATFSKSAKISGAKGHRYVFQITENTAMIGKAAAAGLAKKPYIKYWIAGDDYEYGHAVADGVWQNLKKLKPEVKLLGQSWWKVGEPDFTPYITAILAAKPDAVIVATGGRDCVPFLKAAQATGFNKKVPFYMHTATELATLRPVGKGAPEGVMGTSNYHFYYPDSAANKAFAKEFQDAYGRIPTVGALYGYITAQLITGAYQKAKTMKGDKFVDAVEGMKVNTPVGTVELRAYDHQALLPMYLGTTKKSDKYDFLVADGIIDITPAEAAPDVNEIKKARGK
ncbi:MAG: ABC transporter substrate-binding protein [Desulfarculaceae bacterium]|nr:ABC transporter substrate-binding protein [Desulfarculaceae bacterium]